MIFEVKCDEERTNELTDRTHTRIVSFIVLDEWKEKSLPQRLEKYVSGG